MNFFLPAPFASRGQGNGGTIAKMVLNFLGYSLRPQHPDSGKEIKPEFCLILRFSNHTDMFSNQISMPKKYTEWYETNFPDRENKVETCLASPNG